MLPCEHTLNHHFIILKKDFGRAEDKNVWLVRLMVLLGESYE